MKNLRVNIIARSAIISSVYFVLTAFLPAISYGPIQVRVSEALALLPALMPISATIGLFLGCLLANFYGMFMSITGIYDVIFGSLATLIAAILTTKIKKIWLLPFPSIVVNALVVSAYIWQYFIDVFKVEWIKRIHPFIRYLITALSIGAGEAISTIFIGIPIYIAIEKYIKIKGWK